MTLMLFIFLSLLFVRPALAAEPETPEISDVCATAENPKLRQCCAKLPEDLQKDFAIRSALLPGCAFFEGVPGEEYKACRCRDISDLVRFLINYGNLLIGGVGAFALLFFMYGGFTILLAAGSSDKIQKGKQAIVAAVIGLIIVFSAQLIIRFVIQQALQVPAPQFEEKELKVKIPGGEQPAANPPH